jgi:gas vesicle protein
MQEHRDHGFVLGLLTGTFVGAGLAIWFAPRLAAELRERMAESARNLGERASHQYQQASARVGATVDDLARKGQGVRDDVAGVVARGAHEVARGALEVERYATVTGGDRASQSGKHPLGDRSAPKPAAS